MGAAQNTCMHALSISSGKFGAVHTISAMILAKFVLSPSYVESFEGGELRMEMARSMARKVIPHRT